MSSVANFATGQGVYDATLINEPVLDSSANVGTGDLSLNAVASQYMSASATTWTPPAITAGNGLSFSGWFYPASYSSSTYQSSGATLFDISGTSTSVSMYCDGAGRLTGNFNGNVVTCPVVVRNNLQSGTTVYGTNNGWHFFCYTIYCTSVGTALQSIYLDASCAPGLNQATTINTTPYVQITPNAGNYIGYGQGQGPATWAYFNGKVDDFRFYNRVLTPPEISVLYQYNYKSNTTPTIAAQLNYDVSYTNAVQIDVSGTFSGLDVSRNPTFSAALTGGAASIKVSAASLQLVGDTTWAYVDTTVSPDTSYSYTIKPYIMNTYGSTITSMGSITTTPVLNGFFNQNATLPLDSSFVTVQTYTTTVNALAGWTVENSNAGAIVEIDRGVGWITETRYAAYRGTLPSTVTYWLAMRGSGSGGYSQITQNVGIYTGTSGFLSFYAWPLDASAVGYSSAHTFSVSLGGMTLLNNYSFDSNGGNFAPTNLNFNLPTQSTNAITANPTLPGWSYSISSGVVYISNGTGGSSFSFTSYITSQWLLVQIPGAGTGTTVTQSISFPVGTYTLSYVAAVRPNNYASNITLSISVGANSVYSKTFVAANTTWTTYTTTFSITTADTYPLSFNFVQDASAPTSGTSIGFTISSISPVPALTLTSTNVTNSIMTNYNFNSPTLATDSRLVGRPYGWTLTTASAGIYVANGNGAPYNFNTYTASQYMAVQSPGTGAGTTLTQNVTLPIGTYTLTFVAAVRPLGYNSNITLSISVGANSVYSKTFVATDTAWTTYTTTFSITTADTYPLSFNLVVAATGDTAMGFTIVSLTAVYPRTGIDGVPYTSFNLPFSMTRAGTYPLTITSNCNGMTSGIGLSAVQVRMQDTTALGIGYKTVDPSNLALYYNFDTSFASTTGFSLYDSSNGTPYGTTTLDASMVGGATISSRSPASLMGVNSLYLPGKTSYAQIAKWTLPAAAIGAGFSVCGWIYRSTASSVVESSNATIATFGTGTGNYISIFMNQRNGTLDFSCNVANGPEYISTQYPVQPKMWSFFAMTCSCRSATASASQCMYSFYLNDVLLQAMHGAWPNTSNSVGLNFVKNYLGGVPSGTVITPNDAGNLQDLSGNIDDFRVYNRALSKGDIDALWSYGFALNQYANLIDPTGLGMYYPMDPGSNLLMLPSPSAITSVLTYNAGVGVFDVSWIGGVGIGVTYLYDVSSSGTIVAPANYTTTALGTVNPTRITLTDTSVKTYTVVVKATNSAGTVSSATSGSVTTLSSIIYTGRVMPLPSTGTTGANILAMSSNSTTVSGITGTNNFMNGSYVASSSSDGQGSLPWSMFDDSSTTFWICNYGGSSYTQDAYNGANGVYRGGSVAGQFVTTVVSGQTISGEWLQMKFPYSFILTGYSYVGRTSSYIGYQYVIAGSSNGTTWTQVESKNYGFGGTLPTTGTITTFATPPTVAYSYYRLIGILEPSNFDGKEFSLYGSK